MKCLFVNINLVDISCYDQISIQLFSQKNSLLLEENDFPPRF